MNAKTEPFVLGVDLDGVVADFYGAMRPIVATWLGVEEESLSLKQFSYGLPEWGVRDLDHYRQIHRFAVAQRALFLNMKPFPDAGPALRRLSNDGVHIRIITHRLFLPHFHQEAVHQTVKWLDHHGIPYWDLCFLKEKVDVGAHLYIEDTPENIEKLRAAGKAVIVFANPTNVDVDNGDRANDWTQAERLVREHMARAGWRPRKPEPPEGPANDPSDPLP